MNENSPQDLIPAMRPKLLLDSSISRLHRSLPAKMVHRLSIPTVPWHRCRPILRLMLFLAGLCQNGSAVAQSGGPTLKMVDHIWGFDGRVVPGQFNPLSILLDNQTDKDIDADAILEHVRGMLTVSGGRYVQRVFIAPAGRLWIQFYPYVASDYQTEFRLSINDRTVANITQTRSVFRNEGDDQTVSPQVVILDDPRDVSTRPSSVKHMPERIFPPYASVLFGLHTVYLDHVPDWEQPRRDAFMSWLKQGGRLHLLMDSRGEYPQFSGDMGDLNQPLDRFSLGSGIVIRQPVQREGLTDDMVRRAVVMDVMKGEDKTLEDLVHQQQSKGLGQAAATDVVSMDESFFRGMRELTLPEHAWWLIFLLALSYIGLIFPGCFILSKRNDLHFLTTYAAIVALSVVFSFLFLMIGRRGYGESTNLQTLAIARSEDATHWSVLQWNALFVKDGDSYAAGIDDQQAVYSTGESSDRVNVQMTSGNSGRIQMRIPPYSSQTFVSRRRAIGADWKLSLLEFDTQASGLVRLKIQTGESFPSSEKAEYMVLAGRRLYQMKYDKATQQLHLFGAKRHLTEYCQPNFSFDYVNPWQVTEEKDTRTDEEIYFEEALPVLVRRSLLDDVVHEPTQFELPADRIRLFFYTEVPDELELTTSVDDQCTKSGRILFVRDIFTAQ